MQIINASIFTLVPSGQSPLSTVSFPPGTDTISKPDFRSFFCLSASGAGAGGGGFWIGGAGFGAGGVGFGLGFGFGLGLGFGLGFGFGCSVFSGLRKKKIHVSIVVRVKFNAHTYTIILWKVRTNKLGIK